MNPYQKQQLNKTSVKKNINSKKRISKSFKLNKSELLMGLGLAICLGAAFFAWQDPNTVSGILDRIEFKAISITEANEEGKKHPDSNEKKENVSPKTSSSQKNNIEKKEPVVTEKEGYNNNLAQRKRELDSREEKLKELEKELLSKQMMLEEKIVELEKMRKNISTVLKDRFEVDKSNVEKLVSYYSTMKPQNAAKVIESLEEPLATTVLSHMKKQNAAAILNFLPVEKAKKLTELLAGVN